MSDSLRYEVREIDALTDGECWYWNDSFHIADIEISRKVKDIKRVLLHQMRKLGIVFKRGKCRLETYDGSSYELVVRRTGEPILAFILKSA